MIYTRAEVIEIVTSVLETFENIDMAYLFGSYARGDAREESDVDLLIHCIPSFDLLTFIAVCDALEAALGKKADVVSLDSLKHANTIFANEARREGALIYDKASKYQGNSIDFLRLRSPERVGGWDRRIR